MTRRPDEANRDKMRIAAYVTRLAGYPADIVRHTILGRPWRWWPAWAELHEICEDITSRRRDMIEAAGRPPPVQRRPVLSPLHQRIAAASRTPPPTVGDLKKRIIAEEKNAAARASTAKKMNAAWKARVAETLEALRQKRDAP